MMQGGMGSDMMCPMMRSGMMRGGMMEHGMMGSSMRSGMAALFGSRVTPTMNLSVDDARGYFASQLERLNNKRLKLGDIKSDDGTITADIITVDNSLVQRLKADRHTGAITYRSAIRFRPDPLMSCKMCLSHRCWSMAGLFNTACPI